MHEVTDHRGVQERGEPATLRPVGRQDDEGCGRREPVIAQSAATFPTGARRYPAKGPASQAGSLVQ